MSSPAQDLDPARPSRRGARADARIDAPRLLGLARGEATVLRNAGSDHRGCSRSPVVSQRALGTRDIAITTRAVRFRL